MKIKLICENCYVTLKEMDLGECAIAKIAVPSCYNCYKKIERKAMYEGYQQAMHEINKMTEKTLHETERMLHMFEDNKNNKED